MTEGVDKYLVEAWVVFRNIPPGTGKWHTRLLKDGFQHVEVWLLDRDVWVRLDPCFQIAMLNAFLENPQDVLKPELKPTYLRVTRLVDIRQLGIPWVWGPLTCVDAVKLVLGLRARYVYTPYQLYRYLRKTKGS